MTKWIPGINVKLWLIKIGIALFLLGTTAYIAYEKGEAKATVACAEKGRKEAEIRTVVLMETVEKRVPVIQYIERENVKYVTRIEEAKRKADETINATGSRPECSVTDAERVQFNELIRAANESFSLPVKRSD